MQIGPFDIVVAATGYERTYDYLPAKVCRLPDVLVTMQLPPPVHTELWFPRLRGTDVQDHPVR